MAANVAVTNTTGLYNITGRVNVPNSAQQLLNLLYSNGNVNFSLTGSGTQVQANALVSTGSIYGNANVAAYLPTYTGALDNSSSIVTLTANAATQAVSIATLTANAATQATSINTLNANLGAFETYANATFGTGSYSNVNVAAYLSSNISTPIGTTANIYAGNVILPSNGTFYGNLIAANIIVANIGIQNYTTYQSPTTPTYSKGVLWYDNVEDGLAYYNSVTNNKVNVGQETQFRAYNPTGSTIVQGAPVYINGSFGSFPNIALAQGSSFASSQVAGVANQAIPAGSFGDVVSSGTVANILLVSYTNGDNLYLSSSTPGVLQNYPPTSGYVTRVGVVSYNGAQGRFLVSIVTPVNNQTFGNLSVTGNITTGNISSTNGYFWANGAAYAPASPPNGAAGGDLTGTYPNPTLTTSGVTAGTYGSSTLIPQIVVDAKGRVTSASNVSAVAGFTGNLAGSILYDGVNERFFANAYPLSTPDASRYANGFSNFIMNTPVYTNGILQPQPAATGTQSAGGQSVGGVLSANIALQSAYGSGGAKNNAAFTTYAQMLPVTANTFNVNDRIRASVTALDLNMNGVTWGTMNSTTNQTSVSAAAGYTVAQVLGTGAISNVIGQLAAINVNPGPGGYANVQYASSLMGTVSFNSNVTTVQANIINAQVLNAAISGFSSNLTIGNAIGLHTTNGWAGSGAVGAANNPFLGRYALLNEDSNTLITTAGNITFTSSSKGIVFGDGTSLTTAAGSTYGNTQVAAYLPIATGNFGGNLINSAATAGNIVITASNKLIDASATIGGLILPTGGNVGRTGESPAGTIRYNTDLSNPEWYDGYEWLGFNSRYAPTISANVLTVGGGAAGGCGTAGGQGGGGAGGVVSTSITLIPGTTYTVTVGAGGTAASADTPANNGSASSAFGTTGNGGGGGAAGSNGAGGGGSGGGGSETSTGFGSGTAGQGYHGGTSTGSYSGGGGGGWGAVGANAVGINGGGAGGDGQQSSITGSATYYAGGGGGSCFDYNLGNSVPAAAGGQGGGGTGGRYDSNNPGVTITATSGTANTGGGGGGAGASPSMGAAGSGGSGVVILRILTSSYTGTTTGSPTVTTDGSYTVVKWTSSGSYTA